MRPVDFPLTLLVAEETREVYRSNDLGWHRWASDVRFLPIPGDHISLLVQPHVEETLRQIEEALRQWS
jgi:thioesterase domain-containing protein